MENCHRALTYEGRIHIPAVDSLHGNVISLFQDNPESSHFGALKTAELVSRDFGRPAMNVHVREYVSGGEVWYQLKAPWNARETINMPLLTPSRTWEGVMTDFISNLPESPESCCTGILIIVDELTTMAMYLLCQIDIDSLELAWLFFEHVICKPSVVKRRSWKAEGPSSTHCRTCRNI